MAHIDLNKLRLQQTVLSAPSPAHKDILPQVAKGQTFLKGPIPMQWLNKAAALPGRALHVGIVVWFLAGMAGKATVKLSQARLHEMGVKRNAAYRLETMLGDIRINDLTTAEIRQWHRKLCDHVGTYSANRAKQHLQTVLALAAEDFNARPPVMPKRLGRGKGKEKKAILVAADVATLLRGAKEDKEHGVYYSFPFLAGTRPSEQLGLLWSEVDFEKRVIRIRRIQDRKEGLVEVTKTAAGRRDIPMCQPLYEMLLEWKLRCPRKGSELYYVFPGLGQRQAWPLPRIGGGGELSYANFRNRMWTPALKRLKLPHVTPHSARHSFISTLQAQGVEVGLVAKLAGHANAVVTLSHYTQATRGGEDAVELLAAAFGG